MPNWPANKPADKLSTAVKVSELNELSAGIDDGQLLWLTDSELARYRSISALQRKRQFLAGHFLVRQMAADFHGNSFEDWVYQDGENVPRRLICHSGLCDDLYVSISHSGDYIATAISQAAVGIDIETFGKQRDFMALAAHVFSQDEVSDLNNYDGEELKRRFYLFWTLKESVAKQYGSGLKFELSRVQTPRAVSHEESANLRSWECGNYAVSVCHEAGDVYSIGIPADARLSYWQNAI